MTFMHILQSRFHKLCQCYLKRKSLLSKFWKQKHLTTFLTSCGFAACKRYTLFSKPDEITRRLNYTSYWLSFNNTLLFVSNGRKVTLNGKMCSGMLFLRMVSTIFWTQSQESIEAVCFCISKKSAMLSCIICQINSIAFLVKGFILSCRNNKRGERQQNLFGTRGNTPASHQVSQSRHSCLLLGSKILLPKLSNSNNVEFFSKARTHLQRVTVNHC